MRHISKIVLLALVVAAAAATPAAAAPAAGAAVLREFEGTVVSVNCDARTFRLHDSERGTLRIRVTRNTSFERIAGFGALRARDEARGSHVRRSRGPWIAREVERSGGGGDDGGDDDWSRAAKRRVRASTGAARRSAPGAGTSHLAVRRRQRCGPEGAEGAAIVEKVPAASRHSYRGDDRNRVLRSRTPTEPRPAATAVRASPPPTVHGADATGAEKRREGGGGASSRRTQTRACERRAGGRVVAPPTTERRPSSENAARPLSRVAVRRCGRGPWRPRPRGSSAARRSRASRAAVRVARR